SSRNWFRNRSRAICCRQTAEGRHPRRPTPKPAVVLRRWSPKRRPRNRRWKPTPGNHTISRPREFLSHFTGAHVPAERLQKIIAAGGFAARRKAEELISAGRVVVNGQPVTELGSKAAP